MTALPFEEARACVIDKVRSWVPQPLDQDVDIATAGGRVLAESIRADRDYPPVDRSTRDGFAVRSADVPGELTVIGEVRAGEYFHGSTGPRQAVEIMTGAPVPQGADAVVMIEHVAHRGKQVHITNTAVPGQNIVYKGVEAQSGDIVVPAGRRLGFAEIAEIATVGRTHVRVFVPPRVAILATGDELVGVHEVPGYWQVRNSNSHSLSVQVRNAGGAPAILPAVPDEYDAIKKMVEHGLTHDLLLLSGGVSAGKYDLVEKVLADLKAEFFFDRVKIQPGQPLVFGRARKHFFFGLPGNPASTMVTFEVFARAALELLGGLTEPSLPLLWTRLTRDFHHKPGLTRFLPANLSPDGGSITPVPWQGSSDVSALARSNAFVVAEANRESWEAGDMIRVLPR